MPSKSSSRKRTYTKARIACTSCRSRKIRCNADPPRPCKRCRTRGFTCVYEPVNATFPWVPGGDEVFLHDPYPTNSVSTSLLPAPATNHSSFQLSQSESRHSHSTARESFSQSPSVGHLDDSVRGVWGHSSTNKPSKTEFDKGQSTGYGYPDFPQARGNNIPSTNTNYISSDTTSGRNEHPGNSIYPTGSCMPIQNPSHSSAVQDYGHNTTSGNVVGGAWSDA
ncbi:hypothetical protein L218DRAFT_1036846 [Marasmius fiardii PR-910]|nr:hypothetical protein L218DRAFT_1036846 [Marasmius fiardii PR-910]